MGIDEPNKDTGKERTTTKRKLLVQKKLVSDEALTSSSHKKTRVVKLKRRGGEVIQSCDVYIGRRCTKGGWNLPRSKWANPYTIRDFDGSVKACIEEYKKYVLSRQDLMNSLHELDGKVLGCWCKGKPSDLCHGDVLVELLETQKKMNQTTKINGNKKESSDKEEESVVDTKS